MGSTSGFSTASPGWGLGRGVAILPSRATTGATLSVLARRNTGPKRRRGPLRYLPVSAPLASGWYATRVTPKLTAALDHPVGLRLTVQQGVHLVGGERTPRSASTRGRPHLVGRVVAHPDPRPARLDRVGHQSHQCGDVDPSRREVVLVEIHLWRRSRVRLARRAVGMRVGGPDPGRELGRDQAAPPRWLADAALRRTTAVHRRGVEQRHPAARGSGDRSRSAAARRATVGRLRRGEAATPVGAPHVIAPTPRRDQRCCGPRCSPVEPPVPGPRSFPAPGPPLSPRPAAGNGHRRLLGGARAPWGVLEQVAPEVRHGEGDPSPLPE